MLKKMKNNNFSLNGGVVKKTVIFLLENFYALSLYYKLKNYSNYHKILGSCSSDT